jgi:hypothetical protein
VNPTVSAVLLILGLLLACVVAWKLLLKGVKGISRAVTAGISEGRAAKNDDSGGRPKEESPDLTDELMKATYLLGVSELERAPQQYGYDPDDGVFEPSQAEIDSGTVSMQTLGKAIRKLSPVHPARRVLEEVTEEQARKALGTEEANRLAESHKEVRVLEILKAGMKARAEKP